mmetsp:Transcript_25205/g.84113  ORF Transcript_25205/g.84113 Transcript_25205/m.84113 type:complete len:680 (-) Transcript_25205:472-2511(-)
MECKVEADIGQAPPPMSSASGMPDVFGGLTVGWVTGSLKMEGCELRASSTLLDLARALASTEHTALAVVGDAGDKTVRGLATVTDVMRAYFEGAPPERRLADWLAGGVARTPPQLLKRIILPPSASLAEVAETMVSNALAGDCACHHIVVQADDGQLHGVVSSLDLVRGLCHYESWRHHPLLSGEEASPTLRVGDVMKPRDRVFTCSPSTTMKDVAKELLLINQGSILVADDLGVSGVITQRDVVKAFADGVQSRTTIHHWLFGQVPSVNDRMIDIDEKLVRAANLMTTRKLEHLVVRQSKGSEVVGILSSLDLLLRTQAKDQVLRPMPPWSGPTIGEALARRQDLTDICPTGATLGHAASLLAGSGATSLIVQIGVDSSQLGLLTENGILRSFVDGWSSKADVEDFMVATDFQHAAVPSHLIVPSTMPLTEAASLMMSAAEPGRTCHHLVVRSVSGEWLGVFSALDVARAIQSLPSELDIARTGAAEITAAEIMKLEETVPKCKPMDSIGSALGALDRFCQNAALVVDNGDVLGLITPRCAIQAMAKGYSPDCTVAEWLLTRRQGEGAREVSVGTPLMQVAAAMVAHSVHHLMVVDAPGKKPVGVLSSLDLARGIASVNYHCPFVSLAWLRLFGTPSTSSEGSLELVSKSTHKRRWSPDLTDEDFSPLAGCRRSRTEV